MTTQETKAWLERARGTGDLATSELEERDRLNTMAYRITPGSTDSGKPAGHETDSREKAWARLTDAGNDAAAAAMDMLDVQAEVKAKLARLKSNYHRNVLLQRYILGKDWGPIAAAMGYSRRGITSLHGRALEELAKILTADGVEVQADDKL